MTEYKLEWQRQKAVLDALDDGYGPWEIGQVHPDPLWPEFKKLCYSHLGQGFSLACSEGNVLDITTAYAFDYFKLGVAHHKKEEDAQGN